MNLNLLERVVVYMLFVSKIKFPVEQKILIYEDLKKEIVHCPLCNSSISAKKIFKEETRGIVTCKRCGMVYVNPRPTSEAIKQLYSIGISRWTTSKEYIDKKTPLFKDLLSRVQMMKNGGKILDVGCGIGLFLKLARENEYEAYGVDISDEDVKYAREKFRLNVHLGDLIEANYPEEFFDVVTMWDVIEHLADPLYHFKEIKRILKKDGYLFILTGNIDSDEAKRKGIEWEFLNNRSHIVFFTTQTLGKFLDLAGLKMIYLPNSTILPEFASSHMIRKAMKKMKILVREPANFIDLLKKAYAILIKPKQTHDSSMMILAMRKE